LRELCPGYSADEASTHHLVYGQSSAQTTAAGEVTGGASPPVRVLFCICTFRCISLFGLTLGDCVIGWQPSLFVFDLPEGAEEDFLSGLFSPYGRVDSVKVARGSDGRSQGYGYVNMAHWQDAKAVCSIASVVLSCNRLLSRWQWFVLAGFGRLERP
jgi:hypothetical protein